MMNVLWRIKLDSVRPVGLQVEVCGSGYDFVSGGGMVIS